MKVWVLQYFVYGGTEIIGIYSSKEKAMQVMEKMVGVITTIVI